MTMFHKLMCVIMAVFFMLTLPLDASAADNLDADQIVVSPEIDNSVLTLPEEVAYEIALLFISDAENAGMASWDDTSILNCVTMYDSSGTDTITAYSFELSRGYVVVSARIDVPNIILEWSDYAKPVYSEFSPSESDEIIYLGGLSYYQDAGNGTMIDTMGHVYTPTETTNLLTQCYDVSNIHEDAIALITEKANQEDKYELTGSGQNEYISDIYTYANRVYGGTHLLNAKCEKWSGYDTKYLSMNALANGGYNNHCGPTAITHLAVWYHARYGSDIIAALNNDRTVFQMIADFGINNFYYTQTGGTANALANNYIKRALSQFEINCTVSGRYTTNYTNAYNSLSNNRLLYVMMLNNNNYGDHHVAASAVYKLTNYDMTDTCSFLKVADGHGTSARYLDLDILSNCTYWEVAF